MPLGSLCGNKAAETVLSKGSHPIVPLYSRRVCAGLFVVFVLLNLRNATGHLAWDYYYVV